jgi:paraquat-inducible protein A
MSSPRTLTGRQAGLTSCHTCGLLSRLPPPAQAACCPRCGTTLHLRKHNSVTRTWAFLIAAMILYIPANMLPMMITRSLFGTQTDTILSGVVFLYTSGSWLLALVVFIASIAVPLAKIAALVFLLLSVQRRSTWQPQQRTRLYRLIEIMGRWSMLDIYVIALLVALVQLKSLASVQAGPAALAFGAVVVLTMFAAMSFDPRLLWDSLEENNG